jgi:hypothetical protein
MKLLDALVEQRITAAASRGEFNQLPGAGRRLVFDDDLLVPEEVRVANRILKNAGFVPPAVEQLRALRELEQDLGDLDRTGSGANAAANTPEEASAARARHCQLRARWLALNMALESLRGGPLIVPQEYLRRIAERLADNPQPAAADDSARDGS